MMVYRVQGLECRAGVWSRLLADLIFPDGKPEAILAWFGAPPHALSPLVTVSLDPAKLKKVNGRLPADFIYHGEIRDPRLPN